MTNKRDALAEEYFMNNYLCVRGKCKHADEKSCLTLPVKVGYDIRDEEVRQLRTGLKLIEDWATYPIDKNATGYLENAMKQIREIARGTLKHESGHEP